MEVEIYKWRHARIAYIRCKLCRWARNPRRTMEAVEELVIPWATFYRAFRNETGSRKVFP